MSRTFFNSYGTFVGCCQPGRNNDGILNKVLKMLADIDGSIWQRAFAEQAGGREVQTNLECTVSLVSIWRKNSDEVLQDERVKWFVA